MSELEIFGTALYFFGVFVGVILGHAWARRKCTCRQKPGETLGMQS